MFLCSLLKGFILRVWSSQINAFNDRFVVFKWFAVIFQLHDFLHFRIILKCISAIIGWWENFPQLVKSGALIDLGTLDPSSSIDCTWFKHLYHFIISIFNCIYVVVLNASSLNINIFETRFNSMWLEGCFTTTIIIKKNWTNHSHLGLIKHPLYLSFPCHMNILSCRLTVILPQFILSVL